MLFLPLSLESTRASHPATAAKLLELLGRHVGAFADTAPSALAAETFAFLAAWRTRQQASEQPASLPEGTQAQAETQAREGEGGVPPTAEDRGEQ